MTFEYAYLLYRGAKERYPTHTIGLHDISGAYIHAVVVPIKEWSRNGKADDYMELLHSFASREINDHWTAYIKFDECSHFTGGYNHICGDASAIGKMADALHACHFLGSKHLENWPRDADSGFPSSYDPDFKRAVFQNEEMVNKVTLVRMPIK